MTTSEEIAALGLYPHFDELLKNPAFIYMKRHFDQQSLQVTASTLQDKAERYIAESAIKTVFREFESFAAGASPAQLDVLASVNLEDEDEINEDEASPLEQ